MTCLWRHVDTVFGDFVAGPGMWRTRTTTNSGTFHACFLYLSNHVMCEAPSGKAVCNCYQS